MNKILIICEGESEINFLKWAKNNSLLRQKYANSQITKIKSSKWLKRIKYLKPNIDEFILIHDTDDVATTGKWINDFAKYHTVLLNEPNFDFLIGEYFGYYKDKPCSHIRKIIKKDNCKNINYKIHMKKGNWKNIKKGNYGILKLMNIPL